MKITPTVMIVAGEPSGDQYGARVMQAYRRIHPDARFFGIGGDRMAAEGAELLFHVRDTAIMGFVEVARRLPLINRMFAECTKALRTHDPHALLCIDYPGFNLRLARRARRADVPVVYYVAPQLWAWGRDRARSMRERISRLAVVFPFEVKFFEEEGIPATFVGHPLLEILLPHDRKAFFRFHNLPEDRPVLALLPGSREQEVRRILPVMLEAAGQIASRTGCTVAIGAAALPDELYHRHSAGYEGIRLVREATHPLLQHAHAAIVTSGTATVEAACYETPMTIVYKASPLNYMIGKRLANVSHIGMVNILAGRTVVPELVQDAATADAIADATLPYFTDAGHRTATVDNLRVVRQQLGSPGASQRVAQILENVIFRNG
jgi:lipid-A-disaccharide synthase